MQLSVFNGIKLRYLELYSSLLGDGGDGTTRLNMIKWGFGWFLESPIWGYGIGNYRMLLFEVIGRESYAHNNFIELLVGVGIIGFILYYFMYFYVFYNLYQLIKKKVPFAITLFALFTTWFLAETGAVNYTSKMTYVLLGICIAYIRLNKSARLKRINE
ncbi:O-antigen ligase family protein [Bacillus alkalicola]|uniref:O-antigen ligase family protein n=1 Tax=Evansella alkalicola TaxID=745819 RepID=UPI002FF9150F